MKDAIKSGIKTKLNKKNKNSFYAYEKIDYKNNRIERNFQIDPMIDLRYIKANAYDVASYNASSMFYPNQIMYNVAFITIFIGTIGLSLTTATFYIGFLIISKILESR